MKNTLKKVIKVITSILLVLVLFIVTVLGFATGIIYVFEKGPSSEIRDLFVVTVKQSSAAGPLAYLFLSDEEVDEIMERNSAKDENLTTDTDLVVVDENIDKDAIIVEEVVGPTYNGKIMIINDPSRVYVYSIPDYSVTVGDTVQHMCYIEDAVAGVNGGGYYDKNGQGNGSTPLGIVMSHGQWLNGSMSAVHQVIGLNYDNKLVIGNMTGHEAIESGIRDAVCWGPALIINGEAVDVGDGGGLNPRTAIGQREDGAILLLVINGRQPSSMGASYLDLIGVMKQYGAVNAANLDGGNSSSMVYNGEIITSPSGLYGERDLPTAILVESR